MLTTGAKLIISFFCVGAFFITDAQITGWATPLITGAKGTGTVTFPEDQAIGATSTKFSATPKSGTISSYTLSSAGTPFSVNSTSGVLSLVTALDYEKTTNYTIRITATEGTGSGTATITVIVTDVNESDPVFSAASYSSCIADKSPAGTTLTTVTATDKDTSQTITYAISSGDTGKDFKIVPSTGLIQVNVGNTLDKAKTANYTLVVTAADNIAAIRTGSTTVSVTVADSCKSGMEVAAVSMMMLIVSIFVTLF